AQVVAINKADLRWAGRLESLRRVRSLRPEMFALYSADIALQSARSALILFGAATGARRIVMGDAHGGLLARSRIGALSLEPARLAAELAIGYGVIVPVAWCVTLLLDWFATLARIPRDRVNPEAAASFDSDAISGGNRARVPPGMQNSASSSRGRILYLLAPPMAALSRRGAPD